MTRWRRRIARWLVGPFVNLPERDGVWIVSRMDGGRASMIVEADKFRLKTGINMSPRHLGELDRLFAFHPSRRVGRFVGTVKENVG